MEITNSLSEILHQENAIGVRPVEVKLRKIVNTDIMEKKVISEIYLPVNFIYVENAINALT